jgi:hypothetical protein
MANRIGRYFARGNGVRADIELAALALAFCDCVTRICAESGDFSKQVDDELDRIEIEAMRVFYHHHVQPPDPLRGV